MDAVREFFAMGGYAVYVWPSYGLTAVVLLALLIGSWRGLRARQRQLRAIETQMGVDGGARRTRRRAARGEADEETT
jgi:heme exporter protein D